MADSRNVVTKSGMTISESKKHLKWFNEMSGKTLSSTTVYLYHPQKWYKCHKHHPIITVVVLSWVMAVSSPGDDTNGQYLFLRGTTKALHHHLVREETMKGRRNVVLTFRVVSVKQIDRHTPMPNGILSLHASKHIQVCLFLCLHPNDH